MIMGLWEIGGWPKKQTFQNISMDIPQFQFKDSMFSGSGLGRFGVGKKRVLKTIRAY